MCKVFNTNKCSNFSSKLYTYITNRLFKDSKKKTTNFANYTIPNNGFKQYQNCSNLPRFLKVLPLLMNESVHSVSFVYFRRFIRLFFTLILCLHCKRRFLVERCINGLSTLRFVIGIRSFSYSQRHARPDVNYNYCRRLLRAPEVCGKLDVISTMFLIQLCMIITIISAEIRVKFVFSEFPVEIVFFEMISNNCTDQFNARENGI